MCNVFESMQPMLKIAHQGRKVFNARLQSKHTSNVCKLVSRLRHAKWIRAMTTVATC